MPIISNYPYDTNVQDNDAWIGTDGSNMSTKQFKAIEVANYLNIKGKISISGQMVYKLESDSTKAVAGDFYGPSTGSLFVNTTTMYLNIKDRQGSNVVSFLDYLVGSQILISEQNALENFGHYTISSYTQDPNDNQFYILSLTNIGGNGAFKDQKYYNFATFNLSSSPGGGGTFTFTQSIPADTWTINHNLNKKPSTTVTDNAGTVLYPNIEYLSLNTIELTFTAGVDPSFGGVSGFAYLN
jgi:hypothetical protein